MRWIVFWGVGLLALPAAAQPRPDWVADCAAGNPCTAKFSATYRTSAMLMQLPKSMTVAMRDDAAKPLVSMHMPDTEVRYAQFRLEQPARSSDMVCDGIDCTVSFADARAIIDGMKAGRPAVIQLFTNNGQVAQVRLSAAGFAEAIARTRPNP